MHLPLTFFTEYTLTVDDVASLVASTQAVDSDDCGCSYDTQVGTAENYEQVPEEPAATKRWKGIIGVEGELTGDGRFIQPEALRWESLPIPLRHVSADVGAHSGAVVVGRIDKIERGEAMEDGKVPIFAEGDFDMESEVGREAARQVEDNLMRGVSMDLDDVAFEVRIAADAPALMPVDPQALMKEGEADEDGRVKVQEMSPDDEVMVTTGARVRAATIVAVPAFATAQIGMADAVDEVFKDAEDKAGEEQTFGTVKVKIGSASFEVDISEEKFNWVEDVGGLPAYIREIADALKRKGWKDSRAIPTAVNVTKKMCATGDLNFPGDQDVNPGSRAKACKAVAEWEEKKARAKADSASTVTLSVDDQWRNPDNGRWIDMPGTALGKIISFIEGNDRLTIDEDLLDEARSAADQFEGEMSAPNPDTDEAVKPVEEVLDALAESDYGRDSAVGPMIDNAQEAVDSFKKNYIPAEQADLDKDEDTNIGKDDLPDADDVDWDTVSVEDLNRFILQEEDKELHDRAQKALDDRDLRGAIDDLRRKQKADDSQAEEGWASVSDESILQALEFVQKMPPNTNFGDFDVPGLMAEAAKRGLLDKDAEKRGPITKAAGLSLELDAATDDAAKAVAEDTPEWDAKKIVADLHAKEAEGDIDLDDLSDEEVVTYVVDIYGVSTEVADQVVALLADDEEDDDDVMVAAALPLDHEAPPVAHFSNPNFKEPTPLTVLDDGRVYGHMAIWGTCHLTHTNRGKCVTPPHSKSGYAYFATGAVLTKEGAEVPVGQITLGTGHAAEALNAKQTLAHYDNSGKAVADITVGEDQFGIWFSGSLRPGVTAKQVRTLRAHPLSGDWRRMAGNLELVATLCVNVQGFPVPRPKGRVTSGVMQSLVAAGMLPPRKVRRPGTRGALSMDDLRYLKRLAERERREEQESRLQVLSNADALAQRLRSQKREATLASARKIAAQQMAARVRGL